MEPQTTFGLTLQLMEHKAATPSSPSTPPIIDRVEFVERHPPGKLGSRVRVSFTRSGIGQ